MIDRIRRSPRPPTTHQQPTTSIIIILIIINININIITSIINTTRVHIQWPNHLLKLKRGTLFKGKENFTALDRLKLACLSQGQSTIRNTTFYAIIFREFS